MPDREHSIIDLPVAGALMQPLAIINTPGGPVLHMLRPDYPLMPAFKNGFGEIYFSEIRPGHIKGWKKHREQTQLFCVPAGLAKLVLYDGRDNSPTSGAVCEVLLGRPDNYRLLQIPPGVWYAFTAAGNVPALVCNCADMPHRPEEADRLPLATPLIPYREFFPLKAEL